MKKSLLQKAHEILYERAEEKERQYGPMQDSIKNAAMLAEELSNAPFTPEMIYVSIIAIKLSRESFCHKEDNILDAICYMAALNDYLELKNQKEKEEKDSFISKICKQFR